MHRRCLHASLTRPTILNKLGHGSNKRSSRANSTAVDGVNAADPPKDTFPKNASENFGSVKASSTSKTESDDWGTLSQGSLKEQNSRSVKRIVRKRNTSKPLKTTSRPPKFDARPILRENDPIPGEWKPTPHSGLNPLPLKADLKRYEARLQGDNFHSAMAQSSGLASEEQEIEVEMSFSPGTLIENRKNNNSTLAIVIDEVIENRKWVVQSLASSGEVFAHSRSDVHFAVPNFISSDLASRCGTGYITHNPQELNARVQALKRMRQAIWDIEASGRVSTDWPRQRAVNVYNEVKSNDPTVWAKTTVKHVTGLLWQRPGFINYFATHKLMMDDPLQFLASDNYLKSQTFYVRPLRDVEQIKQVQKWVDDYRLDVEGPMSEFVEKAKQALSEHRRVTPKSREIELMKQLPANPNYVWNENDQVFIQFLIKSMAPRRSNQDDPFSVGRNAILQLLAPPEAPLTEDLGREILVQLGVMAPWQSPWEVTRHANPTADFSCKDALGRADRKIVLRSVHNQPVAGAVLGPEDFHIRDPLDSVRHDFGDLKVFVIDDATAQELDDGVSVERIPSEPGKYWVHAHIADPAAVLHPGHMLSLKARERGSTLYLKHRTVSLFPKTLVHHPQLAMSLGENSRERGDLTLSFSVKVDMEGNILDHKLRAGIVRNVHKFTYDQCDDALGISLSPAKYPFGRVREPDTPPPNTIQDAERADLKLLQQLAEAQCKKRVADGFFGPYGHHANVDYVTQPPENLLSPVLEGTQYQGFPKMEYSVINNMALDSGARLLVAEMMKLASRVASRVGLEHDTLMLRRAMDPSIPASDQALREILVARSWQGYFPLHKFQNHFTTSPAPYYTLQPKGHAALGISNGEGYSRATSPLRRFEDLVVHWNLHHILLGSKAPARPPFSPSDMEQLCVDVATLDRTTKAIHKGDSAFHSLLFLKRWMADTERGVKRTIKDPLSKPLRAYKAGEVRNSRLTSEYHCNVIIPELGIKGFLCNLSPSFQDAPLCTEIKVRVKDVALGINTGRLNVVPVKH